MIGHESTEIWPDGVIASSNTVQYTHKSIWNCLLIYSRKHGTPLFDLRLFQPPGELQAGGAEGTLCHDCPFHDSGTQLRLKHVNLWVKSTPQAPA